MVGLKRKIVALIMSLITVINFSVIGAIPIFAHESVLDVGYDNCIGLDDGDGIDDTTTNIEFNYAGSTLKEIVIDLSGTAFSTKKQLNVVLDKQ